MTTIQQGVQKKTEAVEMVLKEGKPTTEIARNLGIRVALLYLWKQEYLVKNWIAFSGSGNMSDPAQTRCISIHLRGSLMINYSIQIKYRSIARVVRDCNKQIPISRFREPDFLVAASKIHIPIDIVDAKGEIKYKLYQDGDYFLVTDPPTYE